MNEFPKIQSMFKREPKGKRRLIIPHWAMDEFRYLASLKWTWTEKYDGMNIRVKWERAVDWDFGGALSFKGKTDKAQLPGELLDHLIGMFTEAKMGQNFPDGDVCLYGEGYGPGIQKGGNYRKDQGFILFDVKIGHWWLKREALKEIAIAFEIPLVPVVTQCDLMTAMFLTKQGMNSSCCEGTGEVGEGSFFMEGLVGQPEVPLLCRNGQRVICKIKHKDFAGEELTDEETASFSGSSYSLWPEGRGPK